MYNFCGKQRKKVVSHGKSEMLCSCFASNRADDGKFCIYWVFFLNAPLFAPHLKDSFFFTKAF